MDLRLLAETLVTFSQVGLAIAMFTLRLPRRERFGLRVTLVALGFMTLAVGVAWVGARAQANAIAGWLPIQVEFWPFTLFFGLCVLCVWLVFEGSPWNALFCCTMGYTVQNLWVGVTRLLLLTLDAASPGASQPAAVVLLVGAVAMAAVYGCCYWYYARRADREGLVLASDGRLLVAVALVLVFDIAFNSVVNTLPYLGLSSRLTLFFSLTHVVVCLLLLTFEFTMLFSTRLRQEVDTISRVLEAERRQYVLSRENIQAINLKCHDLRHQIRHLEDGGRVADRSVLRDIAREVSVYENTYQTGNEALDVILTEKGLLAAQAGISLQCIADGAALGFMSASDIYSLFGNALDNALEALGRLAPDERGPMTLKVRRRGSMVAVHVANPYAGELTFVDGLPRTSKGDARNHGFGTLSMKMLVERYGGTLAIKAENGVYRLNALIPTPEPGDQPEPLPEAAPEAAAEAEPAPEAEPAAEMVLSA